MVFANKYTEDLLARFQNFAKSDSLKKGIKHCAEDEAISIYAVFMALTDYVVDELIKKHEALTGEELAIYQFAEEFLEKCEGFAEGTDEFDFCNAICTCFLEDLQNLASAGRISYDRFIPYLGEKSKEYCRAWDEFTGVKSPGLW